MAKLYNLARMTTATTGTGTITLGSAVAGFLSFASSGIADGDTVTYAIEDGANSEIGRGVYTSSGTTLTRSVLKSTNSNAAISLSGSAQVFITPAAEDLITDTAGAYGLSFINGTLTASAAANALTISVKTLAGSDPSSSDPVVVVFRSSTASSGTYVSRTITSALSVTVPSSQQVGTSNNVPFKIWVVGLDNSGTVELAVINCLVGGSSPTSVYPINEAGVVSTTAIASAPSAAVFYSTTARTSKAIRILGYVEYSSGLATAGTWSSAPTTIQVFGPGVKRPGDIVQTSYAIKTDTFTTTSTSFTDITGLSTSISPSSAANVVSVMCSTFGMGAYGTNSALFRSVRGSTAIFAGATAGTRYLGSAIATPPATGGASNAAVSIAWSGIDAPGTTSSTTYKIQVTCNAAGTAYVNRSELDTDGVGLRAASMITVQEIMA